MLSPIASEISWREEVEEHDVVRVVELVASTGFFNDEETEIAGELVEERLERGAASGYSFLFADLEDELAAYACFGRVPGTADSFDLYWIVVAPEHQSLGLGSRLLREVEASIWEAGGRQVWVDTAGREQYAPSRAFYARNGYRIAARLQDFHAPGDDKVIFVKQVSGP